MKKSILLTLTLLALAATAQATAILIDRERSDADTLCLIGGWETDYAYNPEYPEIYDEIGQWIADTIDRGTSISVGIGDLSGVLGLSPSLWISFESENGRTFENATILTNAKRVTRLSDNQIMFLWGQDPDAVPDTGSTAGLLGLALGGLAWAGKRSRSWKSTISSTNPESA